MSFMERLREGSAGAGGGAVAMAKRKKDDK
jgi:hypothetical protein